MPPTYQHGRLSLYGTILTTQSWSVNLGFDVNPTGLTNATLNTWLASLQTPLNTWFTTANGPGSINATDLVFIGARAEWYPASSTTAQYSANYTLTTARAGTSGNFGPTQQCIVVSLQTASSSRKAKGRLYVPATGGNTSTGHKYTNTVVDGISAATAGLITAINGTSIASNAVSIVVNGSDSFAHAVTQVSVDNEPDIQRRRANKVLASYAKVTTV